MDRSMPKGKVTLRKEQSSFRPILHNGNMTLKVHDSQDLAAHREETVLLSNTIAGASDRGKFTACWRGKAISGHLIGSIPDAPVAPRRRLDGEVEARQKRKVPNLAARHLHAL